MVWVLIRINSVNRLAVVILMSTHNIGFYEDVTNIIFQFSSKLNHQIRKLISFSDQYFAYLKIRDLSLHAYGARSKILDGHFGTKKSHDDRRPPHSY